MMLEQVFKFVVLAFQILIAYQIHDVISGSAEPELKANTTSPEVPNPTGNINETSLSNATSGTYNESALRGEEGRSLLGKLFSKSKYSGNSGHSGGNFGHGWNSGHSSKKIETVEEESDSEDDESDETTTCKPGIPTQSPKTEKKTADSPEETQGNEPDTPGGQQGRVIRKQIATNGTKKKKGKKDYFDILKKLAASDSDESDSDEKKKKKKPAAPKPKAAGKSLTPIAGATNNSTGQNGTNSTISKKPNGRSLVGADEQSPEPLEAAPPSANESPTNLTGEKVVTENLEQSATTVNPNKSATETDAATLAPKVDPETATNAKGIDKPESANGKRPKKKNRGNRGNRTRGNKTSPGRGHKKSVTPTMLPEVKAEGEKPKV